MIFDTPLFRERAAALLGQNISVIEYPGGRTRNTVRLILDDGATVYATARPENARSTIELETLWALERAGANCPRVLGVDDGFFLQSDVGTNRLSIALANAGTEAARFEMIDHALKALVVAQDAMKRAELGLRLQPLDTSKARCLRRAARPARLAKVLDVDLPPLDIEALAQRIEVRNLHPIKFDTRSANAVLTPSQEVIWLDWDRAGLRHPADDLICLLCDEYTDLDEHSEQALLDRHLAAFTGGADFAATWAYVESAAMLHCFLRLRLITETVSEAGWADPDLALREDRLGAAPVYFHRLIRKTQRWAARAGCLDELEPLFARLSALPPVS